MTQKKPKKKKKNNMWKEFYFNSKLIWGKINSKKDWKKIVDAYNGNMELLRQTKMEYSPFTSYPVFSCFGDRKKTLGEWADENGIDLNI